MFVLSIYKRVVLSHPQLAARVTDFLLHTRVLGQFRAVIADGEELDA